MSLPLFCVWALTESTLRGNARTSCWLWARTSADGFRKRKFGLPTLPCSFEWFASDNPQRQICSSYYGEVQFHQLISQWDFESVIDSHNFSSGLHCCRSCKHLPAAVIGFKPVVQSLLVKLICWHHFSGPVKDKPSDIIIISLDSLAATAHRAGHYTHLGASWSYFIFTHHAVRSRGLISDPKCCGTNLKHRPESWNIIFSDKYNSELCSRWYFPHTAMTSQIYRPQ